MCYCEHEKKLKKEAKEKKKDFTPAQITDDKGKDKDLCS